MPYAWLACGAREGQRGQTIRVIAVLHHHFRHHLVDQRHGACQLFACSLCVSLLPSGSATWQRHNGTTGNGTTGAMGSTTGAMGSTTRHAHLLSGKLVHAGTEVSFFIEGEGSVIV